MAFLPFSQKTKVWEPIAIQLRLLSGVRNGELIDPAVLAERVGLYLVDANAALEGFSKADRDHLLITASDSWSGGVFPVPLPNGKYICITNPNHPRRRNRITLMEEIVHIHRKHKPSGLRDVMPGLRVREYHKDHETEAYGVGAAVLLPWSQFYHQLDAGTSVADMAETFDVTEALIQYRIKVTGATNLYRNRLNCCATARKRQPVGTDATDSSTQAAS
ncbi:MAG: ImmA/IrrE family metallo-endopeptidase [Acidobacteriaceae bacterium]